MTIDEFQQADLRVGRITAAERVEGSEKLLKLQVDFGDELASGESRQIISGIAKAYAPEDLAGRQAVFIVNLDPRMMMGLESQGMLLAAHGEGGTPVVLMPERAVSPGSKIS